MYNYWKDYILALTQVINIFPIFLPASNFISNNLEHINKIKGEKYFIENQDGFYIDFHKCEIDREKIIE